MRPAKIRDVPWRMRQRGANAVGAQRPSVWHRRPTRRFGAPLGDGRRIVRVVIDQLADQIVVAWPARIITRRIHRDAPRRRRDRPATSMSRRPARRAAHHHELVLVCSPAPTSTSISRPTSAWFFVRDPAAGAASACGSASRPRASAPCLRARSSRSSLRPSSGRRRRRTRPTSRTRRARRTLRRSRQRVADDERGPERERGDPRLQLGDHATAADRRRARAACGGDAVGRASWSGMSMYGTTRGWLASRSRSPVAHGLGVEVEDAHPVHARHLGDGAHQVGEGGLVDRALRRGHGRRRWCPARSRLIARPRRRARATSSTTSRTGARALRPRIWGMTQNEQVRLQPSAIFTQALAARGREDARGLRLTTEVGRHSAT